MDTDKKRTESPKRQKEQEKQQPKKSSDNKTGLTGKLQGGRESLDIK